MKYLCLLIVLFNMGVAYTHGQTPISEILKELGELPEQNAQVKVEESSDLEGKTAALSIEHLTKTSQVTVSMNDHQIYQARKGDNPWTIARRFKVDYKKLLEINNISNPKDVQIGQKLKIPKTNSKKIATPLPPKKPSPPRTSAANFYIYTMKPGEDPWILSKKLKVDYEELLSFNAISNPRDVKTGTQLKIPK